MVHFYRHGDEELDGEDSVLSSAEEEFGKEICEME